MLQAGLVEIGENELRAPFVNGGFANARGLDLDGGRIASKQKIALYPANVLPPGDAIGVPVKLIRKEAVTRGKAAETPAKARARVGAAPAAK